MMKALSRRELEDALKLAMSSTEKFTSAKHSASVIDSNLNKILCALSLRHCVEIIDLLRPGPRTAREISDAVGLHRANFSRHLKQLSDVGLIAVEVSPRDARERIVSLRKEPFDALGAWVQRFTGSATAGEV